MLSKSCGPFFLEGGPARRLNILIWTGIFLASLAIGVDRIVDNFHAVENEAKIIEEVADEYSLQGDSRILLYVIRKIENGPKGTEFGVLHPRAKGTTYRNQAQWAAGTIKKRYTGDLKAFASRWCPIGASNDLTGLNKNWYPNAKYYMKKWGGKI